MMRNACVRIVIFLAWFACVCQGFHLQNNPDIRRSVCQRSRPCCPGHVCRAYQRFDASRPVAACARSVDSRPLYAPGSRAHAMMCRRQIRRPPVFGGIGARPRAGSMRGAGLGRGGLGTGGVAGLLPQPFPSRRRFPSQPTLPGQGRSSMHGAAGFPQFPPMPGFQQTPGLGGQGQFSLGGSRAGAFPSMPRTQQRFSGQGQMSSAGFSPQMFGGSGTGSAQAGFGGQGQLGLGTARVGTGTGQGFPSGTQPFDQPFISRPLASPGMGQSLGTQGFGQSQTAPSGFDQLPQGFGTGQSGGGLQGFGQSLGGSSFDLGTGQPLGASPARGSQGIGNSLGAGLGGLDVQFGAGLPSGSQGFDQSFGGPAGGFESQLTTGLQGGSQGLGLLGGFESQLTTGLQAGSQGLGSLGAATGGFESQLTTGLQGRSLGLGSLGTGTGGFESQLTTGPQGGSHGLGSLGQSLGGTGTGGFESQFTTGLQGGSQGIGSLGAGTGGFESQFTTGLQGGSQGLGSLGSQGFDLPQPLLAEQPPVSVEALVSTAEGQGQSSSSRQPRSISGSILS